MEDSSQLEEETGEERTNEGQNDSVDSSGGLGATGTGWCSHSSDAPFGATEDSSGNETPEPETLTDEAKTAHNGLWAGRLRNRQQKEDSRGRGRGSVTECET